MVSYGISTRLTCSGLNKAGLKFLKLSLVSKATLQLEGASADPQPRSPSRILEGGAHFLLPTQMMSDNSNVYLKISKLIQVGKEQRNLHEYPSTSFQLTP